MDKTALYKISYGLYVIGVRVAAGVTGQAGGGDAAQSSPPGAFGGCVVDAFIQSTDAPATAILCSMKRSLTNALIKAERCFTVSVLPEEADPFVIANFGLQSARVADKWARVETDWHDGLPALRCACAGIRLRMTDARELSTHTVFFCDVEDAWQGGGAPLLYATYQREIKGKMMAMRGGG